MAVAGWLLLSLLTVQTVTGQILPHRDLRDAQNALKSDSYDWKQLREHTSRDSEPGKALLSYIQFILVTRYRYVFTLFSRL